MHFGLTGAQTTGRAEHRRFLVEVSPSSEVRRLMETETGLDPVVWERMATETNLLDIEALGWVSLSLAIEETGSVLLCAPYLATVTTAATLLASGDPHGAEAIGLIAEGRCMATLAVSEADGRWDEAGVSTRASQSADGRWRLEGEKSYVVDGSVADLIVVAARRDDGSVGLFLVTGDAPGLSRAPLRTVDQTRKQSRIRLSATPARPLAGTSVATALELAAVGLAAEQVGGAQHCLDAAVDHAKKRIQFGRPIGSFQAVKHLCAEMLLELESARSAALYAAGAAVGGGDDLRDSAAVAQACCSEAYVRAATDSLHIHGGLGFTWDHDSHLYFKRARSSHQLFGDPTHHRNLLAGHVGL